MAQNYLHYCPRQFIWRLSVILVILAGLVTVWFKQLGNETARQCSCFC